ncbi:MAG: EamA/RhaT family transporter [Candidatus Magasanikbacteria bacterium]|nr:EamA/RhaT family transporter [Candidatus Magasanikbacteria bacterium]
MKSSNKILVGSIAIVVAALLWSLDGLFLRPHLYVLPPPLVVFLEHSLGFIVLAPWLWLKRKEFKLITKKQWLTVGWVALFGGALGTTFFTKALFLTGFKDISVVLLLQKLQPIFAMVLAAIFLRERFSARFYVYAALALLGGYLVAFKDPLTLTAVAKTSMTIAGFSVLAAFAWGSSTAFGKYSLKNIHYGLLAALRFGFTVLIMLALAASSLKQIPSVGGEQWRTLLIIVFSSGAVAMYLYYFGLKKVTASLSSLCELAWPFSAVILDYILNHTVLSWTQYLGGLLLVASVTHVTWLSRSRTIVGKVQTGHGQGDKIGARTANLDLALAKNLPKGLYTCAVIVDSKEYRGLLYYGINMLSNKDCLEVHLLNFSGDLYGKEIKVMTEQYVRFPKKFASIGELTKQVSKDLKLATEI